MNARAFRHLVLAIPAVACADPSGPTALPTARGLAGPYTVVRHVPPPRDERLFRPNDLSHPKVLALRPLVDDILADYGHPETDLDRARALRDWVARVAIHPYPPFHPNGSTSNTAVLPPGATWEQVNRVAGGKLESDSRFWFRMHFDGYAMLDRLLGTLDPVTGERSDDGMMDQLAGAHYRIKDIASYRYVQCTYQDFMLIRLWEAAGLHGLLVSTVGHDPAAVFIPDLGRWVYMDPTYNEEFRLGGTGDPLSPLDLLRLSTAGQTDRVLPGKMFGPRWSPDVYISAAAHEGATYFGDDHPDGMVVMGSQLDNRYPTDDAFRPRHVQVDDPQLGFVVGFDADSGHEPVSAEQAFPALGVTLERAVPNGDGITVTLRSNYPHHVAFWRRIDAGPWEPLPARRGSTPLSLIDDVPGQPATISYRSTDARGGHGLDAVLAAIRE